MAWPKAMCSGLNFPISRRESAKRVGLENPSSDVSSRNRSRKTSSTACWRRAERSSRARSEAAWAVAEGCGARSRPLRPALGRLACPQQRRECIREHLADRPSRFAAAEALGSGGGGRRRQAAAGDVGFVEDHVVEQHPDIVAGEAVDLLGEHAAERGAVDGEDVAAQAEALRAALAGIDEVGHWVRL